MATATQRARLLHTDAEYELAVDEMRALLEQDPKPGSEGEERIEYLAVLIEDYDRKHHQLPGAHVTPQEVVIFLMAQHDLQPADLAEVMGGRSRVSEFLSGVRDLSMSQLRALRARFGISADVLLRG